MFAFFFLMMVENNSYDHDESDPITVKTEICQKLQQGVKMCGLFFPKVVV